MRSVWVLAAIAVVAIAAALWLNGSGPRVEPPRSAQPGQRANGASTQSADDASPSLPPQRDEVTSIVPTAARGTAVATNGPVLRVRLLGLVDDVPWTALVRLDIDGHDESGEKVDHLASNSQMRQGA